MRHTKANTRRFGFIALGLFFLAHGVFAQDAATKVFLISGSASENGRIELSPANPVVDLMGGRRYFAGIEHALLRSGIPFEICNQVRDRDTRSLEERAEECAARILAQSPNGACDVTASRFARLVGHSMGGLIARLVAASPQAGPCIESVTTISTPHRGTPLADFLLEELKEDEDGFSLWAKMVNIFHFTPSEKRYLPELRVDRNDASPETFHAQDVADAPGVRYYSISNWISAPELAPFYLTKSVLQSEMKKRGYGSLPEGLRSDGIIPLASMAYGEHLGTVIADHGSSACVEPATWTRGCRNLLAILIPHLMGVE